MYTPGTRLPKSGRRVPGRYRSGTRLPKSGRRVPFLLLRLCVVDVFRQDREKEFSRIPVVGFGQRKFLVLYVFQQNHEFELSKL